MKELKDRQIPIPLKAPPASNLPVCVFADTSRPRRGRNEPTNLPNVAADVLQLQREHDSYVLELRLLLVQRLQLEEEYERLRMYARDTRFDSAITPTKHELGRVIMDMLHCPMRMNEKVLFMLYLAAKNRLPNKVDWAPVLDSMTEIIRRIGDLPASWSHAIKTKKSKTGSVLKHKIEPLKVSLTTMRLK